MWITVLLVLFAALAHVDCRALGSLAHNYVAMEVAPKLQESEPELYQIIQDNWNCYLVGSDYPDTGYMPGATYGEESHWQPFADAYISYLHSNYPTSSPKRDQLIAFLMGVGTHIQSDITSHWTYYDLVALHDFDNKPDSSTAWRTAHSYMDPATDFYVIVNKEIYNHPVCWWVPVDDLVNIYQLMGKNVSREEIIRANAIYYFAVGIDETLVALPAYLYDRYVKIPWGISNLETEDSDTLRYGAFPGQINDSATYLTKLWAEYNTEPQNFKLQKQKRGRSSRPWISEKVYAAAKKPLQVTHTVHDDGSITFYSNNS